MFYVSLERVLKHSQVKWRIVNFCSNSGQNLFECEPSDIFKGSNYDRPLAVHTNAVGSLIQCVKEYTALHTNSDNK